MFNDDHYNALGRVVVAFSSLDAIVDYVIWDLLTDQQRLGQILTSKMSFSRKLEVLDALAREKHLAEDIQLTLDDLIKQAHAAYEERNRVIHSWWTKSDEEGKAMRINYSIRKGWRMVTADVSPEDLQRFAADLGDLSQALGKWIARFYA